MNYSKSAKHSLPAGKTVNNQSKTDQDTILSSQELAYIKPILTFLYHVWWRVQATGFEHLPDNGPAFIVGNTSGYIPWPALMLIYSLMINKDKQRAVHVLTDMDHIEDERISAFLRALNFVPWSYDNAKQLIEQGELIAIFPEDSSVIGKTVAMRNRLKRFDWTKFLPAIEANIPIFPLATLGIDEAGATVSVPWKMKLMPAVFCQSPKDREAIQEAAKKTALRAEGEIQAEINRLLRARSRLL